MFPIESVNLLSKFCKFKEVYCCYSETRQEPFLPLGPKQVPGLLPLTTAEHIWVWRQVIFSADIKSLSKHHLMVAPEEKSESQSILQLSLSGYFHLKSQTCLCAAIWPLPSDWWPVTSDLSTCRIGLVHPELLHRLDHEGQTGMSQSSLQKTLQMAVTSSSRPYCCSLATELKF